MALGAVICLATACGSSEGRAMDDGLTVIARLVRDIDRAGAVARGPVEKATGRSLNVVDEDEYFRSFGAEPVQEDGLSYAIDLREPKPGSGATGGTMLVVRVSGGCASRKALQARYHGLRLTDVPRGRSPDEQAYWTRVEPWGELSFGFSDREPDCLRSVVFRAHDKSRGGGD